MYSWYSICVVTPLAGDAPLPLCIPQSTAPAPTKHSGNLLAWTHAPHSSLFYVLTSCFPANSPRPTSGCIARFRPLTPRPTAQLLWRCTRATTPMSRLLCGTLATCSGTWRWSGQQRRWGECGPLSCEGAHVMWCQLASVVDSAENGTSVHWRHGHPLGCANPNPGCAAALCPVLPCGLLH